MQKELSFHRKTQNEGEVALQKETGVLLELNVGPSVKEYEVLSSYANAFVEII